MFTFRTAVQHRTPRNGSFLRITIQVNHSAEQIDCQLQLELEALSLKVGGPGAILGGTPSGLLLEQINPRACQSLYG